MLGQMSLFAPDKSLPLRMRVSVELITLEQARYTLENFHYLHRARVGRQLNYAVLIDGVVDGVITYAYPMMSAPLLGVPADELVEFARLFLYQNIPHTATCAIGKSIKHLVRDWPMLFPESKPIKLIVSWSDTEYHKGTIYKAANFEWIKTSKPKARGKNRYANKEGNFSGVREMRQDHWHDKDCWVYWLTKERG